MHIKGDPQFSPVRIEPMNEADVAAVASLEPGAAMSHDDLRAELQRPWSRVWVARERGGDVVAFAVAWQVVDELHLLQIGTRLDCRRRGIGRTLMREVVNYARTQHLALILLEVRRSNREAIALYRSRGFSALGVRPRYYPDDEDAIEMVLELDRASGQIVPRRDEVRLEDRPDDGTG
jgi:ribosomal-protein-alanine N-acetyltransferase